MQDGQGAASNGEGKGEFKLGDFSSKLLKRAQTQTSQEPNTKEEVQTNYPAWGGELWLAQALMSDAFGATRKPMPELRAGDRRQAMQKCMQSLDSSEGAESKGSRDIQATLQHASTFTEGAEASASKAEKEALPVKHTFIHFKTQGVGDGPVEPALQWSSAPAIIMNTEFHTKYPAMEGAHIRGDCRPCVYFTKKTDGCRWGADCEFCHLCPTGSLQRKRKEKVKAIREQEFLEKRRFLPLRRADPHT